MSGGTPKSRPCNGTVASSLTIVHFGLQSPAKPAPNCANYQTNLNHPQYSKCTPLRLTLSMLWFLRVPPMVRAALIVLSLATLVATSAGAARINSVQTPAHATITKSTVNRAHSPSRSASRSPRTAKRKSGTATATRSSRTAARRGKLSVSSSSHRTTSSASRSATLRRSRYNGYHSKRHFVALAAVPVPTSRPESKSGTLSATNLRSPSKPAPDAAELSAADRENPREADTLPSPGTDRAAIATADNPLAAPHATQIIAPANGEIAELNRPPIFTGPVSRYTLRGTHDSLVRQNARAEQDSLERIEDDSDLQDRIARGLLVRVPESGGLIVNPGLPEDRRYCRPWTAGFLADLGRGYEAKFHKPLIVSSAVRTVEYQKRLMRTNHNAAEAEGDIVSPHLTGATIDIAKSGLSKKEMLWMRNQLLNYQNAGVLDVEEEFRQRCFHITVYKNYAAGEQSHRPSKVATAPSTPVDDPISANPTAEISPNQ